MKSHYGFDSKPNLDKIKLNIPKPDVTKLNYDSSPKPEPGNGYDLKPHLDKPIVPKPDTVKPNYGYDPKADVPTPKPS